MCGITIIVGSVVISGICLEQDGEAGSHSGEKGERDSNVLVRRGSSNEASA